MNPNRIVAFLVALLTTLLIIGCSSTKKVAIRPNEHIEIGWTPRTIFEAPSYAAWFDSGYANYEPDPEIIDRLEKIPMDSVRITVVYGTWCSDSKREVPHFFKIIDAIKFPESHLTLIAVDRTMDLPPGIKQQYNITNVPTFIVVYRGMEMGRIIESPKTTLEQDLTDLLTPVMPQ
jgi:thiol-disulfide isomerase/thioredoxin